MKMPIQRESQSTNDLPPRFTYALRWLALSGLVGWGSLGSAQVARTITNTSFETPTIALGCQGYVYEARVPGWKTADKLLTSPTADFASPSGCVGTNTMPASGSTRVFEFYSNGVLDNQANLRLNARDGQQFVELSAETASRLYQPMCLVEGETVGFKFSHLGRMSSSTQDVAAFYVGGTSTLKSGTKVVQFGDTTSGTGAVTAGLSINTSATRGTLAWPSTSRYWYDYSGTFVVPTGLGGPQNLSFETVSNASNNTAYGNFLDAVQVTLKPFVEFTGSATSEMENGGGANLPQVRVVGVVPAGGITIAVNIRAAGTTATSPSDYTGVTNITVPAGTYDGGAGSLFKIPLTVVNDSIAEPTEQIIFDLATGAGYTVANTLNCGASATGSATYTILDDDISGRVYEDYNYGGGAGRAYDITKGMSLRPNATIELYNSAGNFVTSTTTDSNGFYSFGGLAAGTYTVRVVNSTVTSSRPGSVAGLLPVETYANGSKVGGEAPAKVDAPAGASGTTLSSLNTAATAAESIASVTVGGSSVPSADFGFNFDTIVNTSPSGQGSLAQFIINSNTLKNTGLAQAGSRSRDGVSEALPAGTETSIFMIPSAVLTNGVAVISIPDGAASTTTSVLPAVSSDTFTSIDGTTQTVNIGDTNTGLLGTGGSVGYINTLTLSQVSKPEVQITGTGTGTTVTSAGAGLVLNANNSTLRGISILGFGSNNDNQGLVFVNAANSALLEQNFLGLPATSTTMCSSTSMATAISSGLWSQNSANSTLTHNIISCNGGNGAHIHYLTSNWTITNNEFRGNAMNTNNLDGLNLASGSSGNTVRGNLFIDNNANGTDSYYGGGSNTYESNTIAGNGAGGYGEIPGIRVYSKNNIIRYNLIQGNYGTGILVVPYINNATDYVTGNLISKNSIFANGTVKSKTLGAASNQIGIDLAVSTDNAANVFTAGNAPYVTPNDNGDGDTGGNNGMNFPVFDTAVSDGTNVYLTGWARPGSTIELFISDKDPGGFGEGKTYLTTVTEGSSADTDTTVSTYANRVVGSIGGLSTQTGTDTTNRFRFVIPLSSLSGVTVGTPLSATATDGGNNTSEFSPWVLVSNLPSVTLNKYVRNTNVSGQKFSTTGANGLPKQVLQYCIAFNNTGGFAPNFKLQDAIPTNTTFVAGSLIYAAPATDLTTTSTSPTNMALPVNASLTQSGTGPVVYNTNASNTVPATGLPSGSSGVICFSVTIN